MHIRKYHTADDTEIVALFYGTVHAVNARHYTKKQLDAWAPKSIDAAGWRRRLEAAHTLVAEMDGTLAGFASMEDTGYFDLLYVHKDFQGLGVGKMLADEIESHARKNGVATITVDASITARPFFERRGYATIRQNTVERSGQQLINYTMQKCL